MGAITNLFGNVIRPLFLGLLILVGLGLLSADPQSGKLGANASGCQSFTSDPDLNRTICRLNPMRLWNTPVGELVPWLAPAAETAEAQ